ncbi:MAG: hypothetical protein DMG97_39535, partial [Acidobacteria bacterium]
RVSARPVTLRVKHFRGHLRFATSTDCYFHLDDNELHRFLELIDTNLTPRAFAFSLGKERLQQLPRIAAGTSVPATPGR